VKARLLAAIRQRDDDGPGAVTPRKVKHQLERGVVTPVHILERDENRLGASERRDHLRQRVKQPALVRLGIDRWIRGRVGEKRTELRKDRHQLGSRGREHVGHDSGRGGAREEPHEIQQRRVRNRPFGLEARAAQHEEAGRASFVGHRAEEPRFADSRFADDQCDATRSIPRACENASQTGELWLPTDQGRTDDIVIQVHSLTRCTSVTGESMATQNQRLDLSD